MNKINILFLNAAKYISQNQSCIALANSQRILEPEWVFEKCHSTSWFYKWGNQDTEILSDLPKISWNSQASMHLLIFLAGSMTQRRRKIGNDKSKVQGWRLGCAPTNSLLQGIQRKIRTYTVRTDWLPQQRVFPWPNNMPQDAVKCTFSLLEKLKLNAITKQGLYIFL